MIIRATTIAFATLSLWLLGPVLFTQIFDGMSAAYAYALIATWVIAAFASMLVKRELFAIPILAAFWVLVFCAAASLGYEQLYPQISDVPWQNRIPIAVGQAIVVISPLVFGWTFDALREFVRNQRDK